MAGRAVPRAVESRRSAWLRPARARLPRARARARPESSRAGSRCRTIRERTRAACVRQRLACEGLRRRRTRRGLRSFLDVGRRCGRQQHCAKGLLRAALCRRIDVPSWQQIERDEVKQRRDCDQRDPPPRVLASARRAPARVVDHRRHRDAFGAAGPAVQERRAARARWFVRVLPVILASAVGRRRAPHR